MGGAWSNVLCRHTNKPIHSTHAHTRTCEMCNRTRAARLHTGEFSPAAQPVLLSPCGVFSFTSEGLLCSTWCSESFPACVCYCDLSNICRRQLRVSALVQCIRCYNIKVQIAPHTRSFFFLSAEKIDKQREVCIFVPHVVWSGRGQIHNSWSFSFYAFLAFFCLLGKLY